MTSPVLPLRAAIRAACAADATLAALLGGSADIVDEPLRAAAPVYALFGPVATRDGSTSSDRGHEQDLSVVVWAKPRSAAGALQAAERIADLLDDAPLAPAGHRLVHLAVTGIETERERATALFSATVRLRAVTEVLG